MTRSFFAGTKYLLSGFRLIFKPKLRRFMLIPLLLNIILFSIGLWFGSQWIDGYIESLLPSWLEWLRVVIWPILFIAALMLIFSSFTILANLLGAPFNSLLAEAVEKRLAGEELIVKQEMSLAKDIVTTISSELGKLLFFGIRAIPLLILFIIPGINAFAPFIWFVFGAWMLVHQYMDFPMANNGLKFKQQRVILKTRWTMIIGFGVAVMFMTLIPILNFFAMPAAVCGATIMWYENFKNSSIN